MIADLGLPSLLAALREAGLGVGVTEVARLHAVFARQPALPEDEAEARSRLCGLLAAVLVKSGEDRQVFERVFAAWFERTEREVHQRRPSSRVMISMGPPVPGPRRAVPKRWWSSAALLVLVLTLGLSIHWYLQRPPPPKVKLAVPPPKVTEKAPEALKSLTAAEIRTRRFESWVPVLKVTRVWTGWPTLGMGLLALAAGGGLWGKLRSRRWVPEQTPEPMLPGPPRAFLTPPLLSGAQLLTQREQESLVWGIGRYIAEEPTRRLDLPATVRATARAAGLPDLHFEHARYTREVWLWTDETADDAALPRLANEVETLLKAYGLPVERAVFRGLPDRLVTAAGQAFAPNEVDERREVALVAVLTDGRLLGYQWAAADRRVQVDALLRGFSSWPRLAFIDFSDGNTVLPQILARHGIPLLAPVELAGFLGSAATPKVGAEDEITGRSGDLAWAAVCALGPAPVAEETAFELRERLHLSTSPWALRALRQQAPGPPGRLHWNPVDRARRLAWLRGAEEHPPERVSPQSLLGWALDLWEEIYDRELASRAKETGVAPWQGTPAKEHLLLERVLLRLWRQPEKSAGELYPLYRGALSESIRQHLAAFVPEGLAREGRIELPWRWESLSPVSQVMLREMGFAEGVLPPIVLGRSSRLRLGVGLCLGLGLGALAVASLLQSTGRPKIKQTPGRPADAWESVVPNALMPNWIVTVGTRKWSTTEVVEPGSLVTVRWEFRKRPCVEILVDGTEIWQCGSVAAPPVLSPQIPRSVVALRAHPGTQDVEDLALALLDSGSADTVVVGDKRNGFDVADTSDIGGQLLILGNYSSSERDAFQRTILVGDGHSGVAVAFTPKWDMLTAALHYDSEIVRSVREVWPGVAVVAGDAGKVMLRGLGSGCRLMEGTDANGMAFVRICPGTFRMGWPEDPQADSDERPAHEVTLSEFWMGKTEVTNRQYRLLHPDHQGQDDLPATDMSWDEAKGFCERFGYRLPTEAEWEYACRAGTTTEWSFGSDEGRLGEYAWFNGNSGRQLHPIGRLHPNPWGLYDMHGNAWERVADWFGPYSAAPQVDPIGPPEGNYHVLRGGSFDYSPGSLSSAFRFRVGVRPGGRFGDIGFRCARGPRQP